MEECHYFDDLVSKQRTVSVPTLDSTDPLEGVLRQVFIVRTGPNHRALMFLKLGRNCCQEKTNPRYCRVFFTSPWEVTRYHHYRQSIGRIVPFVSKEMNYRKASSQRCLSIFCRLHYRGLPWSALGNSAGLHCDFSALCLFFSSISR